MLRDDAYLYDILESARMIQAYLSDMTEVAFLQSIEKQDAVCRRFEVIGEAARRLSPSAVATIPGVPWKLMVGMRNILIHDYGEVDPRRLWKTSRDDLPKLIQALEQYFSRA